MNKTSMKCHVLTFFLIMLAAVTFAEAKIIIGEISGAAGEEVLVPIYLEDAAADTAMVFLRLDYDTARLEEPVSIANGAIASGEHTVEFYVPEEGRVNIMVDGGDNLTAFTSQNGEVAVITFPIKEGVIGEANVSLTEMPVIPKSGLLDTEGKNVTHTVQSGTITRINDWVQY